MKRRDFLKATTGAATLAVLAPRVALAQSAAGYENLLVLVELKGGNDGLNTVVPYADRTYYSLRPRLAIKREEVLQLDGRTGLNPALAALMPLWQARELAVVQGVGYPRPNLSHFRSIEIWDTASKSEEYLADGWLTRAFAMRPVPQRYAADGVVIGSQDLGPLTGTGARAIALTNTAQFERQARMAHPVHARGNGALSHVMKIEQDVAQAAAGLQGDHDFKTVFPQGPFGNAVKTAAQVVASPGGVAAVRLTLNGFDTHVNQPNIHANLLKQLGEGLAALKSALVELGRWDRTLVMTYAEFGRRPQGNGSNGTDHGTANAHFVAGGRVRGGLYGQPPQLDRLENGNLVYAIDFRSLYATALERWWGVPAASALGGRYAPLDVLRA
jgi:uncharacterized protein (DUF1501 family)